jgi:hypothetical protein
VRRAGLAAQDVQIQHQVAATRGAVGHRCIAVQVDRSNTSGVQVCSRTRWMVSRVRRLSNLTYPPPFEDARIMRRINELVIG